jgi:hypothetical protein
MKWELVSNFVNWVIASQAFGPFWTSLGKFFGVMCFGGGSRSLAKSFPGGNCGPSIASAVPAQSAEFALSDFDRTSGRSPNLYNYVRCVNILQITVHNSSSRSSNVSSAADPSSNDTLPPGNSSGATDIGNAPGLYPFPTNVKVWLPGTSWATMGVIPTSLPSTLSFAPDGTEYTVTAMGLGGAAPANSGGKFCGETAKLAGVPAATAFTCILIVSLGETFVRSTYPCPIRICCLSKRKNKKVAREMRLADRFVTAKSRRYVCCPWNPPTWLTLLVVN